MQPFDQNIRSSFIYYFFSERPFDQKLWSSLIYFFYLHTTIRLNYMVLFHLFFLLRTTIRPKDMVLFHFFFFFCAQQFDQKFWATLIYYYYLHTTIRPKYMVLFLLVFSFANDQSTKIHGPLSFVLSFCTIIRPKIRVLINLFLLFVHDCSTKVRGHSYSLIYSFLNFANISYAKLMTVLPLYFVHYIHGSAALIFCTLYSWVYEVLAHASWVRAWMFIYVWDGRTHLDKN